jgi:triosephosphate isomerase
MNRKYRKTIIAGNWKMNMLAADTKNFAAEMKKLLPQSGWCETVVCVPAVLIPAAIKAFRGMKVNIGAQNMNENKSGAFTGEISAEQLVDAGAKYVIIGHSERRALFCETDTAVNSKIHAALQNKLRPIVCVGESEAQREMGLTVDYVSLQVKAALSGVPAKLVRQIVIAYEPLWAIGTGETATPDEAEEVCSEIRRIIRGLHGARVARSVSILYGGSVNEKNAAELFACPDIDGALVGGASLAVDKFVEIISASV